jgi:SAM-dependent methyltransferase
MRLSNFIGKSKTPETLGRYYINKSYARWSHHATGMVLEIGGGRKERYSANSITLDLGGNFDPDVLASGYNLPFKHEIFDAIISTEVLEHLERPTLFVDEVYRVLKSNGTFFLTTRFIHEVHGEDFFRYTKLSLKMLFNKFRIVKIEEQGSIVSVLSYLTGFIFPSALRTLFYKTLRLFYPLIAKIDQYGQETITLGYSIYGRK